MDIRRRMDAHRPDLERRARGFGIVFTDRTDTFDLARRVHDHEDELRRPELEAKARRLGVRTHFGWGPFKSPRHITDLSLACYDEEQRRRLMREYGIA